MDWFTSRKEEKIPLPEYKLSFLWQEKNIAVAVDQVGSLVMIQRTVECQRIMRRGPIGRVSGVV